MSFLNFARFWSLPKRRPNINMLGSILVDRWRHKKMDPIKRNRYLCCQIYLCAYLSVFVTVTSATLYDLTVADYLIDCLHVYWLHAPHCMHALNCNSSLSLSSSFSGLSTMSTSLCSHFLSIFDLKNYVDFCNFLTWNVNSYSWYLIAICITSFNCFVWLWILSSFMFFFNESWLTVAY